MEIGVFQSFCMVFHIEHRLSSLRFTLFKPLGGLKRLNFAFRLCEGSAVMKSSAFMALITASVAIIATFQQLWVRSALLWGLIVPLNAGYSPVASRASDSRRQKYPFRSLL